MSEGERPLTEEEKKKLNFRVTIDNKQMEEQIKRITELEPKSHAFEKIAEELAEKLRARGVDVDSSQIKDLESFQEHAQTYAELAKKEERNSGQGASGSVPLTRGNSTTSGRSSEEFSSIEELVNHMRDVASGNSVEAKEAQLVLNELWKKTLTGLREQPAQMTYDPNKEKTTDSEVQKMLQPQRRNRRKHPVIER